VSVYGKRRLPGEDMPTVSVPAAPSSPPPLGEPRASGGPGFPKLPGWLRSDRLLPRRLRRRKAPIALGVVAVLILATAVTSSYAYAGDIPRGTTVLGADLGGKSRAEAVEVLKAELTRRGVGAPVAVQIGDQKGTVKPSDVGLSVDLAATVDAAAAQSPGPVGRLFGSRDVDPVVTVDAARLDARLRQVLGKAGQAMTMPAIRFTGTTPKPVYPAPGYALNPDRSAEAVRAGWLRGGPVEVPVVEINPVTTREDVDRLLAELAEPAVAAGVTVTTAQGGFTVLPAAIAKSLVLTADRTGRINPRVDEKKLRTAIEGQLPRVETEARNATYTIAGGRPKVVPSVDGRRLDTGALSRDLLPVLSKSDDRVVQGKLTPVEPKTSTDDLGKLGIKERISSFTTRFTGGLTSPRSQNIVQIAKEVDGALVLPGETFSLNGHTGPRGEEQGYQEAPVILEGKLVKGIGGGASQFTTTLFNATYYAGLEDVQHKPHSYYFSRYPPVIESTIFYPDLDFKFRNDSPHGVLLDTSWTDSTITVSVWSTRVYGSVTTEWSARRDIVQPKTVYLPPGPDCIEASGSEGFAQDAWRIFRKGGQVVKREKFSWRYEPEPIFVCGPPPSSPPS
jgi:vancomycin resistance protein YoaR